MYLLGFFLAYASFSVERVNDVCSSSKSMLGGISSSKLALLFISSESVDDVEFFLLIYFLRLPLPHSSGSVEFKSDCSSAFGNFNLASLKVSMQY